MGESTRWTKRTACPTATADMTNNIYPEGKMRTDVLSLGPEIPTRWSQLSHGTQMPEMQLRQPLCKRLHGRTPQDGVRATCPDTNDRKPSHAPHGSVQSQLFHNSNAINAQAANKHLYLMMEAPAQEHPQLVDEQRRKQQ
ncbi:hypothetical protein NDU88_001943 [Pleurodeles waltl]|uniref:Uncharacterized protein n=1 Tax=Pleurodeles waltl TaxID=8319 RepID=A0AAV7MLX3_PLEWA|nr:hypothetical protein NDU88_001943 [Pleurodeles waltl]